MRNELVQLASKIDWDWIDYEIALLNRERDGGRDRQWRCFHKGP